MQNDAGAAAALPPAPATSAPPAAEAESSAPGAAAASSAAAPQDAPAGDPAAPAFMGIVGGLALIFGVLFGVGELLLGSFAAAAVHLAIATVGGVLIGRALRRRSDASTS